MTYERVIMLAEQLNDLDPDSDFDVEHVNGLWEVVDRRATEATMTAWWHEVNGALSSRGHEEAEELEVCWRFRRNPEASATACASAIIRDRRGVNYYRRSAI